MLIQPHHIRNAFIGVKNFARNSYHHGRKILNTIDGYSQLFKRGFNAAIPMLEELGGGRAVGHVKKGIKEFDSVRQGIVDLDARGQEHFSRISEAVS